MTVLSADWCGEFNALAWPCLNKRGELCLIITGPGTTAGERREEVALAVVVVAPLSTDNTLGWGALPSRVGTSYLRIPAKPIPPSRHTMEHQLVPAQQLVL